MCLDVGHSAMSMEQLEVNRSSESSAEASCIISQRNAISSLLVVNTNVALMKARVASQTREIARLTRNSSNLFIFLFLMVFHHSLLSPFLLVPFSPTLTPWVVKSSNPIQ